MMTLYRIIDLELNQIVAEGLDLNQARETLEFLQLDYPSVRFEIEPYTKRGLGRDPDLH